MHKTKYFIIILFAAAWLLSTECLAAAAVNNSVTGAPVPVSAEETELLWSRRFGKNYKNAPSTPSVVGDTLIVMSGNVLYKLGCADGSVLAQTEMADAPSFGYTPPLYADGMLFCPLDNGTVQAFAYDTLEPLWVYRNEKGGQSLSPILYRDGCIYTGFWIDEDEGADFVCIDVSDTDSSRPDEIKNAKWSYESSAGFYWAGCAFCGNCVIVGTDDGTVYADKEARLLSFDCGTGRLIDSMTVMGDQRSGITVYKDTAYFVTKAGLLYGVGIDRGTFGRTDVKKLVLGGASTSAPVIYNGRLYVGVQGTGIRDGSVAVIDAEKLSLIYSVPVGGYPQNSVLLCDAYYEDTGNVYIYTTYNAPPGGIAVFSDSDGQTSAKCSGLFVPEGDMTGYCISRIAADGEGTLFYKNDSGYIFAVGRRGPRLFARLVDLIDRIISFIGRMFGWTL